MELVGLVSTEEVIPFFEKALSHPKDGFGGLAKSDSLFAEDDLSARGGITELLSGLEFQSTSHLPLSEVILNPPLILRQSHHDESICRMEGHHFRLRYVEGMNVLFGVQVVDPQLAEVGLRNGEQTRAVRKVVIGVFRDPHVPVGLGT